MDKWPSNDFQEYLEKYHQDPKARALFDKYGKQLEKDYQRLQLRKARAAKHKSS